MYGYLGPSVDHHTRIAIDKVAKLKFTIKYNIVL